MVIPPAESSNTEHPFNLSTSSQHRHCHNNLPSDFHNKSDGYEGGSCHFKSYIENTSCGVLASNQISLTAPINTDENRKKRVPRHGSSGCFYFEM